MGLHSSRMLSDSFLSLLNCPLPAPAACPFRTGVTRSDQDCGQQPSSGTTLSPPAPPSRSPLAEVGETTLHHLAPATLQILSLPTCDSLPIVQHQAPLLVLLVVPTLPLLTFRNASPESAEEVRTSVPPSETEDRHLETQETLPNTQGTHQSRVNGVASHVQSHQTCPPRARRSITA